MVVFLCFGYCRAFPKLQSWIQISSVKFNFFFQDGFGYIFCYTRARCVFSKLISMLLAENRMFDKNMSNSKNQHGGILDYYVAANHSKMNEIELLSNGRTDGQTKSHLGCISFSSHCDQNI